MCGLLWLGGCGGVGVGVFCCGGFVCLVVGVCWVVYLCVSWFRSCRVFFFMIILFSSSSSLMSFFYLLYFVFVLEFFCCWWWV